MSPWVLRLVVANTVVYLLTAFSPEAKYLLTFVPAWVLQRPWTLFTYMFVHADPMHLLLNMLALYFFGPRMEVRLGTGHFLGLYFLSGFVGAVLTFFLMPFAAVVGASGAVMGVLAAYARFWPEDRIYIWGVLPVTARLMVIGTAVYSIVAGFGLVRGGNVAHFAHLGGLAAGWLYVVVLERRRKGAWERKVRGPRPPLASRARAERWARIQTEQLHEVNREEVERLLAKLRQEGPRALTPAEADFLDRFAPTG